MATLIQTAAFPLLFLSPFYSPRNNSTTTITSTTTLTLLNLSLGVLLAIGNILYAVDLQYLSLSSFSLLCATQLAFNAIFSFFIKSQKFTSLIFNSIALVTLSASLMHLILTEQTLKKAFQKESMLSDFYALSLLRPRTLYFSLLSNFRSKRFLKRNTFSSFKCRFTLSLWPLVFVGGFVCQWGRKWIEERA